MTRVFALVAAVVLFSNATLAQAIADWVENSDQPEDAEQLIDGLLNQPLDLNRSSVEAIAALPGFDAGTAQRIVALRERDGGIRSMTELGREVVLTALQREVVRELCMLSASPAPKSKLLLSGSATEQQADGVTKRSHSRARYEVLTDDGLRGFALARQANGRALEAEDVSAGVEFRARRIPLRVIAGDFQLDHGTGLVSSSAYGSAGWLRQREITTPSTARGPIVKPTAGVMTRWRGGAVEAMTRTSRILLGAGENALDAATQADGTVKLIASGATDDELGMARRGRLREQFAIARVVTTRGRTAVSAVALQSNFAPRLAGPGSSDEPPALSGDALTTGSICVNTGYRTLSGIVEVGRSGPGRGAVQTAITIRGERLALLAHTSHVSPRFYSVHGQTWNGFRDLPGNESVSGVRIAMMRGRHTIQAAAASEATPFRTSTSPLRKIGSYAEASWNAGLSDIVEGMVLGSRTRREETSPATPAVATTRDRLRIDLNWRTIPELGMRCELRSAAKTEGGDRDLGSLVYVQAKQARGAWRINGRVTSFNFESDAVSASAYESVLPGEYPLVALSGTGSRSSFVLARRCGAWQIAIRTAYQSSRLQSTEHRGWEAALALTLKS
ncbi:helix-hairpin-helix domain-containing protein [candidate division KSB1 bacterium]|nr:helix-hairpin-helix domain-containing protein [candidate division KSB1 bacterium]